MKLFILDKHGKPKPEPNVLKWCAWFETHDRQVDVDDITSKVYVSTVFLGIDHNFSHEGLPKLWETLIFGGPMDGKGERYSSLKAAQAGHKRHVLIAKGEYDN